MSLVRILAKVAFGVFLGGVLGSFFSGGDWIYSIVWSVAIPLFILAGTFGGLRRLRSTGPGNLALARIETVQRAASYDGGRQGIDLRLVVAPKGASAYTTTTTLVVLADDFRKYNAGTVLVVARPVDSRPDVTIVPSPPADWAALAAQAQRDSSLIPTASAAPAWEAATTTTPGTARPGARIARGGAGAIALSVLIIAASAAVTLIPVYPSIARAFSDLTTGNIGGGNMVTGIHQQEAVDEIATVAGSYQFTGVNFYDSYVIVEGLTAPGASTVDGYMWRYGRAWREGPALIQPTDLADELFDASELDFSIIGDLVDEARKASTLDGIDSTYVYVKRNATDESTREPIIYISVSNAYFDASFQYGFDGELIQQSGTAFDR